MTMTMCQAGRTVTLAVALAATAFNAKAQGGNISAGHAFAREACKSRHMVEAEEGSSRVIVIGPAFSMDPDTAARHGYNSRDFDLGHNLRLVDGEHDVFGDGSVVCLPTPGHTAGHQSLRVRLDSGDVVLAADACYFCPAMSPTARQCWPRSTGSKRWKRVARVFSPATTPNSGDPCRWPRRRSVEAPVSQRSARYFLNGFS
jgi:hypothetical protein